MVAACLSAADELAAEGIDATVWDARVVSPPDVTMLEDAARHRLVVTAEDGVRHGGAGAFLLDAMAAQVESAGLPVPGHPGPRRSPASTWRRARPTTSWPASGSTAPASPRPSAGLGIGVPARARTPTEGARGPARAQAELAPFWRTKSFTA